MRSFTKSTWARSVHKSEENDMHNGTLVHHDMAKFPSNISGHNYGIVIVG